MAPTPPFVGVAVLHRAARIDDRRDVEIGIVAVIIIARAAARVGVVPADGQRVDVVRVPQVLVQRIGVAVLFQSFFNPSHAEAQRQEQINSACSAPLRETFRHLLLCCQRTPRRHNAPEVCMARKHPRLPKNQNVPFLLLFHSPVPGVGVAFGVPFNSSQERLRRWPSSPLGSRIGLGPWCRQRLQCIYPDVSPR